MPRTLACLIAASAFALACSNPVAEGGDGGGTSGGSAGSCGADGCGDCPAGCSADNVCVGTHWVCGSCVCSTTGGGSSGGGSGGASTGGSQATTRGGSSGGGSTQGTTSSRTSGATSYSGGSGTTDYSGGSGTTDYSGGSGTTDYSGGSGTTSYSGGGTSGGSGGGCTADSQCPTGQYCNQTVGTCPGSGASVLEPGSCTQGCSGACGCTQDSDCAEGEACLSGSCTVLDCIPPPVVCLYGCTLETTAHGCFTCLCDSCPPLGDAGPSCDLLTCNGLCCGDICTDPTWDSMNCGACGNACATDEACTANGCQPALCALDGGNCCGSMTCGANQACCNATGDVIPYPPFTCVDVDAGQCPAPCACA